jgi:hypothetical protein
MKVFERKPTVIEVKHITSALSNLVDKSRAQAAFVELQDALSKLRKTPSHESI